MKRGLLGGTFDPVHLGHLIVAEEVRTELALDEVSFLPTGVPWMKRGRPISEGLHRLAMVELAVASNPHYSVLTLEMESSGDTYTVDTLEELAGGLHGRDDLFFILGTDALDSFHRWRDPRRVVELATLVVVTRPGHGEVDLESLDRAVPGISRRLVQVRATLIEISGAEIRRRVSQGRSIRYLVPDAVADYIEVQGLYVAAAGAAGESGGQAREG